MAGARSARSRRAARPPEPRAARPATPPATATRGPARRAGAAPGRWVDRQLPYARIGVDRSALRLPRLWSSWSCNTCGARSACRLSSPASIAVERAATLPEIAGGASALTASLGESRTQVGEYWRSRLRSRRARRRPAIGVARHRSWSTPRYRARRRPTSGDPSPAEAAHRSDGPDSTRAAGALPPSSAPVSRVRRANTDGAGTTSSSTFADEITPGSPAPGWVPAPTR